MGYEDAAAAYRSLRDMAVDAGYDSKDSFDDACRRQAGADGSPEAWVAAANDRVAGHSEEATFQAMAAQGSTEDGEELLPGHMIW